MITTILESINSIINFKQIGVYWLAGSTDLSEETLEELRMLTSFSTKEIIRLRKVFLHYTGGPEVMTKSMFCEIPALKLNPLLDRICLCFGLVDELSTINFEGFIVGVASFNAPGRGEVKMKTAFRIQDFDGDGVISKSDLRLYIQRITTGDLREEEVGSIIEEVFRETSSDPKQEQISFADFQRVVILLDFQAKLHLPL